MIESSIDLKAAANQGRLSYIDQGPNPAALYVFGGARAANILTPAAGSPLCIITLATPAGTVDAVTGALIAAARLGCRVRPVATEQAASHRHAAPGDGFAEQRETKTDMAEGPAWIQRFPS